MLTYHWAKNQDKKAEAQIVLAFLLVLVLADRPRFCLAASMGLIVGLTIGGAVLTGRDIAINLFEFS